MSLTGAFLILFVTFHVLMNGVALFWPTAYNEVCLFLGANWYALIGTLVLAAGFVLHIIYAIWLTIQNRKARGSQRYAVTARQPQVEWSSKNMLVLGIVVLAFLLVHLYQFWAKMQLAEIAGFEAIDPVTGEAIPAAAGTWFIQLAFQNPVTLVIYLIGFIALWFHMPRGFWSMFQTAGWNGKVWMNRLKCIGTVWATCVVLLFAVEAIVFTVQANKGVYTECPALQQQYMDMLEDGEAVSIQQTPCAASECTETVCIKAEECTEAVCNSTECPNESNDNN